MSKSLKQQAPIAPRFRGEPVDLVVDVRSKLEFWTGHLPGAVSIPVEQLLMRLAQRNISKSSRIVVYCAVGTRSAAATAQLLAAGYLHVVDGGGMAAAWNEFIP